MLGSLLNTCRLVKPIPCDGVAGLRSVLEGYADVEVVREAWNSEEAIRLVDRLGSSIVIKDINMLKIKHRGTGQAQSSLSGHRRDRSLVNAGDENKVAMLNAGASLLLTKEPAVEHLYGAIQERMQQRSGSIPDEND
jgi:DNA-binding NarL/FixJ family response regulator